MNYSSVSRNGYFLGNPLDRDQDVDGQEEQVPDLDILYAPFTIYHKKGSVGTFFHSNQQLNLILMINTKIYGIKTGADEPLWIVNIKKSIASQLQLDVTGVRDDFNYKSANREGEKSIFNVMEVFSKQILNNGIIQSSISFTETK